MLFCPFVMDNTHKEAPRQMGNLPRRGLEKDDGDAVVCAVEIVVAAQLVTAQKGGAGGLVEDGETLAGDEAANETALNLPL